MSKTLNLSFFIVFVAATANISVSGVTTHGDGGVSTLGVVDWYGPCFFPRGETNNIGRILNVTLSHCDNRGSCYLPYNEPLQFVMKYSAGGDHKETLYNFVLRAGGSEYYISGGSAGLNITQGSVNEFPIDFVIPDNIRNDDSPSMMFYIFEPHSNVMEVCVSFLIDGLVTLPDPTTVEPTTTEEADSTTEDLSSTSYEPITTTEEGESTTPGPFTCQDFGVFPDPVSCIDYHVCTPFADGSFWDQVLTCPEQTVYCPDRFICDYPEICPCRRT